MRSYLGKILLPGLTTVKWLEIHERVKSMIRSVFEAAASVHPEMHSPTSRAIYGLDVMLDSAFQPKLLEVCIVPLHARFTCIEGYRLFVVYVFVIVLFPRLHTVPTVQEPALTTPKLYMVAVSRGATSLITCSVVFS